MKNPFPAPLLVLVTIAFVGSAILAFNYLDNQERKSEELHFKANVERINKFINRCSNNPVITLTVGPNDPTMSFSCVQKPGI